ncbi:hypothetical protein McaMca56_005235 [Microsporum canis]
MVVTRPATVVIEAETDSVVVDDVEDVLVDCDGDNKKETPSLSGKNNSPTEEVEEEVEDDEEDDDDDEEVVVDDSVVVREIELEVVLLVVCSLCVKIICVD